METLSRDADPFLGAVEALTHPGLHQVPLERWLALCCDNACGAFHASQAIVAFERESGAGPAVVCRGEGVDERQRKWLRTRVRTAELRPAVELVSRRHWDEGCERLPCLAPGLRSGAVVNLSAEGVLVVGFRTEHLFSDRELRFLRTLGHLVLAALRARGGAPLTGQVRGGPSRPSRVAARRRAQQRLQAQEAERKRISAELHDGVGQSLTAAKFALEACLVEHDRDGGHIRREMVTDALSRIRHTMDEVRRIALDLRPAMLDDLGLIATLQWFCREFQRTYHPLRLHTWLTVDEQVLTPTQRVAIYRIAQEALNNVAKHAQAGRVDVELEVDGCHTFLRVRDDGRGMAPRRSTGIGISGMRERAEASGGRFTVDDVGGGTLVEACWPLEQPPVAEPRPDAEAVTGGALRVEPAPGG